MSDETTTKGTPETSEGEGKNTGATEGQAPAPAPTSGDGKTEKTFTQAELDRIVSDRLAEEKRRADEKTTREANRAKQQALVEAGDWQKLAEERQAELEALKPQAEGAAQFAAYINTTIDEEVATWPAEVKALDPGKDALAARMAWVKTARPLAQKLKATAPPPDTEAGKGNSRAPGAGESAAGQKSSYRFQNPGDVSW